MKYRPRFWCNTLYHSMPGGVRLTVYRERCIHRGFNLL